MANQFFYDSQVRKYLLQFARLFSGFQVERGKDSNGNPILMRVPIMYGDQSRNAATVLNDASANNIASAPLLTYYITALEYDRNRIQDPTFLDKMNVRQREYNTTTGQYTQKQGDAFTIERIMPVPYILRMNVDLWTSSTDQKLQFFEQVGVLFNPALDIQSNDSIFDWSSLTTVFQEGPNWSSRSIPVGNSNPIDIMTWRFSMPIWITSPAKLKKMGIVHKIITNVFEGAKFSDITDEDLLLGTRQKITPYGYKLLLIGDSLQLLPARQPFNPDDIEIPDSPDTSVYWTALLDAYGVVRPGISQIRIEHPALTTEMVGVFNYNTTDDRLLTVNFDAQTLPQDSMLPVLSIIDPHEKGPGIGLANAVLGQRYLIIDSIGSSSAWGDIIANANDIIEYDGTKWNVVFNSLTAVNIVFVTNLNSMVQYRFDGANWTRSIEGWYDAGSFSIVI